MPPRIDLTFSRGYLNRFMQRSKAMRHIDDGYSYEFYNYQQDVLDYYRRKMIQKQ